MRRSIFSLLFLLCAIAVVLAFVVGIGCSSSRSNKGQIIKADHSVPELIAALHRAEQRLGREYRGATIHVNFYPGDKFHSRNGGYWLKGGLGGKTYRNFIELYTDPKTGKATAFQMEHEMAHVVLGDTLGEAEEHRIMKQKGYTW